MRKLFFVGIILILGTTLCLAESVKYRYCIATETSLMIGDFNEPFPEEKLSNTFYSLNTQMERLNMESRMRNLKSFFYSGEIMFVYADYTKNPEDPETCALSTPKMI